jgi:Integrase core domain
MPQPFVTSAARAAAMQPWLTDYNTTRPHSALGGQSPLIRLTAPAAKTLTTPRDTSDPEPGFVGVGGVKPRAATAAGGLGLTPLFPTQARSAIGGDNVLGNDT